MLAMAKKAKSIVFFPSVTTTSRRVVRLPFMGASLAEATSAKTVACSPIRKDLRSVNSPRLA